MRQTVMKLVLEVMESLEVPRVVKREDSEERIGQFFTEGVLHHDQIPRLNQDSLVGIDQGLL